MTDDPARAIAALIEDAQPLSRCAGPAPRRMMILSSTRANSGLGEESPPPNDFDTRPDRGECQP